jgi:hypothetical protein
MRNKLIAAAYLAFFSLFVSAAAVAQTIPSDFKKAVTFIFLADRQCQSNGRPPTGSVVCPNPSAS